MEAVLTQYQGSFSARVEPDLGDRDHDLLMDVFGLTHEIKDGNRQYWGRELGMCWQLLVKETLKAKGTGKNSEPRKYGADSPYDIGFDDYAIDTKYRIGSGDAGTLKKFKSYGTMLRSDGYTPLALILREDNLPAAMTALHQGGWQVTIASDSFDWIADATNGFRLDDWLAERANQFPIR